MYKRLTIETIMTEKIFKDILTIEKDIKNILSDRLSKSDSIKFLTDYPELIEETVDKIYSINNGIKSFLNNSNTITLAKDHYDHGWHINDTFTLIYSKNYNESVLKMFYEDQKFFFKVDQESKSHNSTFDNFTLNFNLNTQAHSNKITFKPRFYDTPSKFKHITDYINFNLFWRNVEFYLRDSFQAIHNNYDAVIIQNTKQIIDVVPILLLAAKHEELTTIFPDSKPYYLYQAIDKLNTKEAKEIMEVISLKDDTDANKILENYIANTQSKPYFKNFKLP